MSRARRLWMMLAIIAAVLGVDQASKRYAIAELRDAGVSTYLGDTLRIQYAENPGAFLSLLGGAPDWVRFAVLTVATGLVLVGVVAYALSRPQIDRWSFWALALIAAGGVGNLIDRVAYDGKVIDFLNIGLGTLRTGIFNVADMAIMAGFFMLLAQIVWPSRFAPAEEQTSAADAETAAA